MITRPARLLAGAEPFEYPGRTDLAVLLVHGFTGSPAEMRPLGESLAASGIGSVGPLLRGHGTHPDDMLGLRFADWIEDVEGALDRLLERHQRAVVVGLSMGGTLALNVAARRANDPRLVGVATLGAPVRIDDWRLPLLPILSRFITWHAWGRVDVKDEQAWERHVGYRRFRPAALAELVALMADTRTRLAGVRQPILILQAEADHVVPARNAQLIHDGVSSQNRRVRLLHNCYHVVTIDFAAEQVHDELVRFVENLAAPAEPA